MTLTYLRGGLSTCSVVWVSVRSLFLTFIKFFVQLCKNFVKKLLNPRLISSSPGAVYACATLFGSALLLRLSATLSFGL